MNKGLIREVLLIIIIPALIGILYHALIRDPGKRLAWIREKPVIDTVDTNSLFNPPKTNDDDSLQRRVVVDTVKPTPPAKPPIENGSNVPNVPVNNPPDVKPLITSETNEVQKKALAVTYNQVVRLNADETVLFFDARNEHEFAEGTIPRAKNIFAMDFEKHIPYIFTLDKNSRVVVFCGGGDCDLSHELSDKLIQFGFKKVFIYLGGYTEWKNKQGK